MTDYHSIKNTKNRGRASTDTNFLLHDVGYLQKAIKDLAEKERVFGKIIALDKKNLTKNLLIALNPADNKVKRALINGMPYYGFGDFVDLLIGQQISGAAAASIRQRLLNLVKDITPDNILAIDADKLRAVGLSRQKLERVILLAQAVQSGTFRPSDLPAMPTAQVISTITQQKGFGEWSGENFVIFSLGRVDVFPKGDLALQMAHRHLFRRPEPLSAKKLEKIALRWQPHRSTAALMLWYYYDSHVKNRNKDIDTKTSSTR